MDYYTIVGMVVVALIAFFGSYASVKKNVVDDRKPIEDLNNSITELNINFKHMLQSDDIRDKRIEKHGMEIDEIKEKQQINEKLLDRHEQRIGMLEKQNESRR